MAQEWAAVGVPHKTVDPKGRPVNKGESYYKYYGNNKSHLRPEDAGNVLDIERQKFLAKSRGTTASLTPPSKPTPPKTVVVQTPSSKHPPVSFNLNTPSPTQKNSSAPSYRDYMSPSIFREQS